MWIVGWTNGKGDGSRHVVWGLGFSNTRRV